MALSFQSSLKAERGEKHQTTFYYAHVSCVSGIQTAHDFCFTMSGLS